MGRIVLWVAMGLLVTGLALAAQSAQAQVPEPYLTLDVSAHGVPVEPITGNGTASFTLTLVCDEATIALGLTPYTVSIAVEADQDWVDYSFSPSTIMFEVEPQECIAGTTNETSGTVTFVFGPAAPAGETVMFTLTASSDDLESVDDSWQESVGASLRASAVFAEPTYTAEPETTQTFEVVLENTGNAPTTVSIALQGTPPEGFTVVPPGATLLNPGETETVEILVEVPGSDVLTESRHEFAFDVAFSTDVVPEPSEQVTITTILEIEGLDTEDSPLPATALLLALFGMFAWMHRHRR